MDAEYESIDIQDEDMAMNYYKIRQQLSKLAGQLEEFVHLPKYCLPFLQPGRLVKVFENTMIQKLYTKLYLYIVNYIIIMKVNPLSNFNITNSNV